MNKFRTPLTFDIQSRQPLTGAALATSKKKKKLAREGKTSHRMGEQHYVQLLE